MEKFNYEDSYMGTIQRKNNSYRVPYSFDYRLKRLTEQLKLKKGRLLDIGCGGGIVTESLVHYYPGIKIYGCDVSAKAISLANKLGSGEVKYSVIDGKKFPYKDNYFDACIALDVMEHVPDVDFFLKEVNRVLKRKGKFYSHTPAEGQFLTLTWLWNKIGFGNKMTYKRYGHIHPEFTHRYIEKILKNEGFHVKSVNYSEHIFFQLFSLFFYFLPLEILDFIFKKDAELYKDKSLFGGGKKPKDGNKIMHLIRKGWIYLSQAIRKITNLETDIFKTVSLGALKVNILAVKNK